MKKTFFFIFFSYFIFFFLFPPFQNPDEQGHYELVYWVSYLTYPYLPYEKPKHSQPGDSLQVYFANVVQHTQYIPNFTAIKSSNMQKLTDYPLTEKKQFTPYAIHAFNPPLYYVVASIFLWIGRILHTSLLTQFYIVRLSSGLFYFAIIFLAYKIILKIFKEEKVANSLILFFGLNPLLIQSGVGIGSDIAVTFFTTLFLYLVLQFQKLSFKGTAILGLVAGLAALSRTTGFILIPGFAVFLYFSTKSIGKFIKQLSIFVLIFFTTQIPWFLLNFIRYHTPIVSSPAIGEVITKGVFVSIPVSMLSSLWGFRHVFMHFSGFLGWNEAFPFPPIFIIYTVLFITLSLIGVFFSWKSKDKISKLMITSIGFLFLLFFSLDVIRKVHSHQGWETGGRDAILILLPLFIFTVKGFAILFRKKVEQVATYIGYFAIWYYYFILIFVLLPRYYV